MNKRINIGVIGCGYWGPNLVRNFIRLNNCTVKFVCDIRKERLRWIKSLYPSLNVTKDYKEIIKDPQIDAVCIATPANTHFRLAKEFLNADKHILVEKPLSITSSQAKILRDLARRKKKILMVSHTYLYSPGIRRLREAIRTKELGKILYITSVRVNLGLFQKDINVVMDLAPHDISILNFILDKEPCYVSCTGSWHYTKGIEDVAFINLYYPFNIIAHVHLSWIDPVKIRRITAVGMRRMAVYDDLETEEPLKIIERSIKKIPYYKTYREFKMLYRFGDIHSPRIKPEEPLYEECDHFIDCILNNKRPLTSGEEGLKIVKILELANRSIKNKGRIFKI